MVHQTMNKSSTSAPSASSTITHTARLLLICAAILGGCATRMQEPEAPASTPVAPSVPAAKTTTPNVKLQGNARWVEAAWSELPGWGDDKLLEFWPALLRSCTRPAPGWARLCAEAALTAPGDEMEARLWLMQRLKPWRVESSSGETDGLATGYFEPQIDATRRPRGDSRIPVLAPPADLATRRPYFTRREIESGQAGAQKPIAYVADTIELLAMQIQGSGRMLVTEPDGRTQLRRLAFSGQNDQPYQSIGKLLQDRGELRDASWPAIRDWARQNPSKLNEVLWSNPRYVFFREEPLPDPELGPRGSQGVPLTPGRSVAVDKTVVPLGTPIWLDTTQPRTATPLRRLAMAQDVGGAITGAVRLDYFWGWGAEAEEQAGRMKQGLRMWVLWPR